MGCVMCFNCWQHLGAVGFFSVVKAALVVSCVAEVVFFFFEEWF